MINEHKNEDHDGEAKEHTGEGGDGEIHIGSGGMITSKIVEFLHNHTHHIIPCIAKDEMSTPTLYKG